jgi:hypothetical protein
MFPKVCAAHRSDSGPRSLAKRGCSPGRP